MRKCDRSAQIHEVDFRVWILSLNENVGYRKVVVRDPASYKGLSFVRA